MKNKQLPGVLAKELAGKTIPDLVAVEGIRMVSTRGIHGPLAEALKKAGNVKQMDKPLTAEEMTAMVEKVKKKQAGTMEGQLQQLFQNLKGNNPENHKLALPTSEGLTFIKVNEILYCKASGNYTEIFMKDGKKHLVSRQLKEYDDLLTEHDFFRIHHSALINLSHLQNYVKGDGGHVVMIDNACLDVSRRKKDDFLEKIGYKS